MSRRERSMPSSPDERREVTDEELLWLFRKLAHEGRFPFDRMIEQELSGRLVIALARFSAASDRASKRLERLTWALVALTVVIAVLTLVLVLDAL